MEYVYKLDVKYPEGSRDAGWAPPGWWQNHVDPFVWPSKKRCLSPKTAQRWKARLEHYGATVSVVRSHPIEWDE